MILTDFISGGFGIIEALIKAHKIDEWCRLIFGFALTGVTAFCGATGAALVNHTAPPEAIGCGLLATSGALTALFMYHPRTRGIVVVTDAENMPDMSRFQMTEKTK